MLTYDIQVCWNEEVDECEMRDAGCEKKERYEKWH